MKKFRLLILITALVMAICSCDAVVDPQSSVLGAYVDNENEQQDGESAAKTEMSVLYYKDMDTNPVTTTCYANSELLKLIYSPLVRVDDTFKPYGVLAESFTRDKMTVTVRLRSGLVFSDGSPVTATDVVKSFDAAKKNAGSPYNRQTSSMLRYYAQDEQTFVCVFSEQVADVEAMLDIPVMKNGEPGVGCGPYVFSEKNGKNVLVVNEKYFDRAGVPVIYLVETKNDENITNLFSAGELDIISSAQSSSLSLTSMRDYSIISYPSNNLIYIGVNYANESLSDPAVRRALSAVLDRDRLAEQSLVGLADPARYPFNPCWYRMSEAASAVPDTANPTQLLNGKVFSLLVPSGSDIKKAIADGIAENLKSAQVTVNITEVPPEGFEAAVKSGEYDLYLAETAISRTMDPTFLYKTGGSMNYFGFANEEFDAAYERLRNGEISLSDYLSAFSEEMPLIPVVFRKNVMYCDKNITGFSDMSPWNSFGNFMAVKLT